MTEILLAMLDDGKYFLFGSGQKSNATAKEVEALNHWVYGVPIEETKKAITQLKALQHKKAYFVNKLLARTE